MICGKNWWSVNTFLRYSVKDYLDIALSLFINHLVLESYINDFKWPVNVLAIQQNLPQSFYLQVASILKNVFEND